jgi:pimeloyl-ACP methyl ester carboxylesterase
VIAGERDQNAHLSSIISAYYMLPNSQLAIIPNTTHTVFLENFIAVWESIVPSLKQ